MLQEFHSLDGEDGGHELGLDLLEVGAVVEALDDDLEGPGEVALDLLVELVLRPDGLEDPDVVLGQGGEAVDGHLEGHLVAAALGEVDDDVVALDPRDAADVPGAVVDEVARVEGDVLLEVGHRLVDVRGRMGEVGEPDVVLEVRMVLVLAPVALDDLAAAPGVLLVVVDDHLEDVEAGVQSPESLEALVEVLEEAWPPCPRRSAWRSCSGRGRRSRCPRGRTRRACSRFP